MRNRSDQSDKSICNALLRTGYCENSTRTGYCENSTRCKQLFAHPKLCQYAINYGTWDYRGCRFGKECKNPHPILCEYFMRDNYCKFGKHCKRYHPKKIMSNYVYDNQRHSRKAYGYENQWKAPYNELQETMSRMMKLINSGAGWKGNQNREYYWRNRRNNYQNRFRRNFLEMDWY